MHMFKPHCKLATQDLQGDSCCSFLVKNHCARAAMSNIFDTRDQFHRRQKTIFPCTWEGAVIVSGWFKHIKFKLTPCCVAGRYWSIAQRLRTPALGDSFVENLLGLRYARKSSFTFNQCYKLYPNQYTLHYLIETPLLKYRGRSKAFVLSNKFGV